MIHLHNLLLIRDGKKILDGVSWDVERGQHWVMLGLNGSGKTTLLNIINGYIWPSEGTVQVLGETFGQTYVPDLRKRIGRVSSAMIEKFHKQDNAIEIVLSGKFGALRLFEKVSNEEIAEAVAVMKQFHCDHLANQLFHQLSQGEKQRVQIARAFFAQPEILILDEPCTGLDLIEREHLLQTIEQLAALPNGPTLLYVTHHVEEVLPCFTHVLLVKDGRVVGAGERQEIVHAETLSEFFGVPVAIQMERGRAWLSIK